MSYKINGTIVIDNSRNLCVNCISSTCIEATQEMVIPSGNTAGRPGNGAGRLYFDTDESAVMVNNGSEWKKSGGTSGIQPAKLVSNSATGAWAVASMTDHVTEFCGGNIEGRFSPCGSSMYDCRCPGIRAISAWPNLFSGNLNNNNENHRGYSVGFTNSVCNTLNSSQMRAVDLDDRCSFNTGQNCQSYCYTNTPRNMGAITNHCCSTHFQDAKQTAYSVSSEGTIQMDVISAQMLLQAFDQRHKEQSYGFQTIYMNKYGGLVKSRTEIMRRMQCCCITTSCPAFIGREHFYYPEFTGWGIRGPLGRICHKVGREDAHAWNYSCHTYLCNEVLRHYLNSCPMLEIDQSTMESPDSYKFCSHQYDAKIGCHNATENDNLSNTLKVRLELLGLCMTNSAGMYVYQDGDTSGTPQIFCGVGRCVECSFSWVSKDPNFSKYNPDCYTLLKATTDDGICVYQSCEIMNTFGLSRNNGWFTNACGTTDVLKREWGDPFADGSATSGGEGNGFGGSAASCGSANAAYWRSNDGSKIYYLYSPGRSCCCCWCSGCVAAAYGGGFDQDSHGIGLSYKEEVHRIVPALDIIDVQCGCVNCSVWYRGYDRSNLPDMCLTSGYSAGSTPECLLFDKRVVDLCTAALYHTKATKEAQPNNEGRGYEGNIGRGRAQYTVNNDVESNICVVRNCVSPNMVYLFNDTQLTVSVFNETTNQFVCSIRPLSLGRGTCLQKKAMVCVDRAMICPSDALVGTSTGGQCIRAHVNAKFPTYCQTATHQKGVLCGCKNCDMGEGMSGFIGGIRSWTSNCCASCLCSDGSMFGMYPIDYQRCDMPNMNAIINPVTNHMVIYSNIGYQNIGACCLCTCQHWHGAICYDLTNKCITKVETMYPTKGGDHCFFELKCGPTTGNYCCTVACSTCNCKGIFDTYIYKRSQCAETNQGMGGSPLFSSRAYGNAEKTESGIVFSMNAGGQCLGYNWLESKCSECASCIGGVCCTHCSTVPICFGYFGPGGVGGCRVCSSCQGSCGVGLNSVWNHAVFGRVPFCTTLSSSGFFEEDASMKCYLMNFYDPHNVVGGFSCSLIGAWYCHDQCLWETQIGLYSYSMPGYQIVDTTTDFLAGNHTCTWGNSHWDNSKRWYRVDPCVTVFRNCDLCGTICGYCGNTGNATSQGGDTCWTVCNRLKCVRCSSATPPDQTKYEGLICRLDSTPGVYPTVYKNLTKGKIFENADNHRMVGMQAVNSYFTLDLNSGMPRAKCNFGARLPGCNISELGENAFGCHNNWRSYGTHTCPGMSGPTLEWFNKCYVCVC